MMSIEKSAYFLQKYCGWSMSEVKAFIYVRYQSLSLEGFLPKLIQFYRFYHAHQNESVRISRYNPFTHETVLSLAHVIHAHICHIWPQQHLLWDCLGSSLTTDRIDIRSYTVDHPLWMSVYGENYLTVLHKHLQDTQQRAKPLSPIYQHSDPNALTLTQQTVYYHYVFTLQRQYSNNVFHFNVEPHLLKKWVVAWCHHHQKALPIPYGRDLLTFLWIYNSSVEDLAPYLDPKVYYHVTQPHPIGPTHIDWKVRFSDCQRLLHTIETGAIYGIEFPISLGSLKQQHRILLQQQALSYAAENLMESIDPFLQPDDYRILASNPFTFGAISPNRFSWYLQKLSAEQQQQFVDIFRQKYPFFAQWHHLLPLQDVPQSIAYMEQDTCQKHHISEMNIHL